MDTTSQPDAPSMATQINLEDVDAHIQTLQSQITFLAQWLDSMHDDTEIRSSENNGKSTATRNSRNSEWLASEVITIKGATSILYDKWRYLRKRSAAEGLLSSSGKKEGAKGPGKDKEKRLSIEGVKSLHIHSRNASRAGTPLAGGAETATSRKRKSIGNGDAESTGAGEKETGALTPPVKAQKLADDKRDRNEDADTADYQVQYTDISSAVQQRMRETRLRSLQETTPTSQKRKREMLDVTSPNGRSNGEGEEGDQGEGVEEDALAALMSPPKKLKTIGGFEPSGMGSLGEMLNGAQGQRQEQGQRTMRKRVFSASAGGSGTGAVPLDKATATGQRPTPAEEEQSGAGRARAKRRRI